MTQIALMPAVGRDIQCIFHHLEQQQAHDIPDKIGEIMRAFSRLLIPQRSAARPPNGKRELVIGRRPGYLALYRYVPDSDIVYVLSVRSQREAGYK